MYRQCCYDWLAVAIEIVPKASSEREDWTAFRLLMMSELSVFNPELELETPVSAYVISYGSATLVVVGSLRSHTQPRAKAQRPSGKPPSDPTPEATTLARYVTCQRPVTIYILSVNYSHAPLRPRLKWLPVTPYPYDFPLSRSANISPVESVLEGAAEDGSLRVEKWPEVLEYILKRLDEVQLSYR
jgi:hypothetical protein